MPSADGFQVLEEIRQDPELAKVPVIVLTASTYAEDVLAERTSQLVIHRPDGLGPAEILRCLQAVVSVLEPRYDERSAAQEAHA
jgi:CheY-like chemotaxis protein